MKKTHVIFILTFISTVVFCQEKKNYEGANFSFIGYIDKKPIYKFYPAKDPIGDFKKDVFYTPSLNSTNQIISFVEYKDGDANAVLIQDEVLIKYANRLIYKRNKNTIKSIKLPARLNRNVVYDTINEVLIFSFREGVEQKIVKVEKEFNKINILSPARADLQSVR